MSDSIKEIIVALVTFGTIIVWMLATNNAFGSASPWLMLIIPAFCGLVVTIGHDRD